MSTDIVLKATGRGVGWRLCSTSDGALLPHPPSSSSNYPVFPSSSWRRRTIALRCGVNLVVELRAFGAFPLRLWQCHMHGGYSKTRVLISSGEGH